MGPSFYWFVQDEDALRVVRRRVLIEYADFLHAAQRLLLGEREARCHILRPIPTVPEQLRLTGNQPRREWLAGRQDDGAVILDNSQVLPPEVWEGNQAVPTAICDPIRQIGQNHIDAVIRVHAHAREAVYIENAVDIIFHAAPFSRPRTIKGTKKRPAHAERSIEIP